MAQFLHEVKHPKATEVSKAFHYRLPMPWRTLSNQVDCGVFTMRHMETFMGCEPGEFKSGFKNESAAQDLQLHKLRFRYMNRIMLSGHNLIQRNNHSEADEFSALSAKVRTNMLERAQDILVGRLAEFG